MVSTWLAIVGLAFAALALWLQRTTFFIQYVFFLRFPLLIALLMVLLPLLAGENNPKVVQNWFELDFVGMSIVAWLAILLAWAVMYAAGVLFFNVASRNDLENF